jgi:hypothetical protein
MFLPPLGGEELHFDVYVLGPSTNITKYYHLALSTITMDLMFVRPLNIHPRISGVPLRNLHEVLGCCKVAEDSALRVSGRSRSSDACFLVTAVTCVTGNNSACLLTLPLK